MPAILQEVPESRPEICSDEVIPYMTNIREIILESLYTIETENVMSHMLIRNVSDKYDYLPARDKAFFKRVTEGTISAKITLDYVINLYSRKSVDKMKPMIRCILRMSVYQLLFMDKVPDNAICDEAVKLCNAKSRPELSGFVNAILRKIASDKTGWRDKLEGEERITKLSVLYSVPDHLVRMIVKEQKNPESLLKSLSEIRPTTVRITDSGNESEIVERWTKEGISFRQLVFPKGTYEISDFEGMNMLPGFAEGQIIVQDRSSMLAALALGVKPGEDCLVADVCAAPGGKTTHIATLLNNSGRVMSRDISEEKTSKIVENVERLGLKNVEVSVHDATVPDESLIGKCDYVLADVPCSGLGVMGRKSDIRFHVTNEMMMSLCELQKKIVDTVVSYVKPGGVFVYSTCTIHKAENEKMVKYILNNHPFEGLSLRECFDDFDDYAHESDFYVQFRPDVNNTDGFFVARFRRIE